MRSFAPIARKSAVREPARVWFVFGLLGWAACGGAAPVLESDLQNGTSLAFRPLAGFYELSGVTQLSDGRLLVVEDEPRQPFGVLSPDSSSSAFSSQRVRWERWSDLLSGGINDLEGVTQGTNGWVYAITSHSRKANGQRTPNRERLLRFKIGARGIHNLETITHFRGVLVETYPELKKAAKEKHVKRDGGLNIEGLAFDLQRKILWVGLRAPLQQGRAILVAIENPHAAFGRMESLRLASRLFTFDLDGGGIRGLAFSPDIGGLLLLSQRDTGKKQRPSKLWCWRGDLDQNPKRIRIKGIDKLGRAEGVAQIEIDRQKKLIIVLDDGDRGKRRPASYLIADLDQLLTE